MKRLLIGLAVGAEHVRAVAVAGDVVRWAIQLDRGSDEPLQTTLVALLAQCPVPRWPRPNVIGAIGPAGAQVKRITGLPALTDSRDVDAAVRESTRRFFLQNGVPLVTSGVDRSDGDCGWAAAFDAPIAAAIDEACRIARLSLIGIVPSAIAIPYAVADTEIAWQDGAVRTEITTEQGHVHTVRRMMAAGGTFAPSLTPIAALAVLGDRATSFADAYGATRIPPDTALRLRVGGSRGTARPSRRRLVIASVACVTGLLAALIVPDIAVWYSAQAAARSLSRVEPTDRAVQGAEAELAQVTAVLRDMHAFESQRQVQTRLLRDLTHALPVHSALVALTVDTTTGTLVALGPDPASIVSALEHVPEFASPHLLGPVTPETVGSEQLERLTVAFRIIPMSPDASDAQDTSVASSDSRRSRSP